MSKADDLHTAIMQVVMEKMNDENYTYADVFGALAVCRAFFDVEYSVKMASTWRDVVKKE